MSYLKHCYWVSSRDMDSVREDLKGSGLPVTCESHLPCRLLRSSVGVGWASPEAWNGACKRKTSWYRRSAKSTQSLFVSNLPLDLPGLGRPTIVRASTFRPERIPSQGEIDQLLRSVEY